MNCTVIILAGGQGIRMSSVGRLSAKTALVAYDRPLLSRLLHQAEIACFPYVLVSTSPAYYSQLSSVVSQYRDACGAMKDRAPMGICVLENRAHTYGPLEALGEALKHVTTPLCLMCLGDMFFCENPFLYFVDELADSADCLGVAHAVDPEELTHGGLVYCDDQKIRAVVERPGPVLSGALRWSGMALFHRTLTKDLDEFLQQAPIGSPEGDLFEFRRRKNYTLRAVPSPDFVNVNSPDHLLLASIYAAAEAYREQHSLYYALLGLVMPLRHALATRTAHYDSKDGLV